MSVPFGGRQNGKTLIYRQEILKDIKDTIKGYIAFHGTEPSQIYINYRLYNFLKVDNIKILKNDINDIDVKLFGIEVVPTDNTISFYVI